MSSVCTYTVPTASCGLPSVRRKTLGISRQEEEPLPFQIHHRRAPAAPARFMTIPGYVRMLGQHRVDYPPLHTLPFPMHNPDRQNPLLQTDPDVFEDNFARFRRRKLVQVEGAVNREFHRIVVLIYHYLSQSGFGSNCLGCNIGGSRLDSQPVFAYVGRQKIYPSQFGAQFMTTTTTTLPPAPTWDLEAIFPGGSGSKEFADFRTGVKTDITTTWKLITSLPEPLDARSAPVWTEAILAFQDLIEKIELVQSFAHCLVAQNVADSVAHTIEGESDIFVAEWEKMRTTLEARAIKTTDAAWDALVSGARLVEIKFFLNELREQGREKMSPELESLALDLSVNGIHAWNRLYDKMAADLMVDFEENGTVKQLSLGQLATKMSEPNRKLRRQAFEKLEGAWDTRADLAAMTLNALGGFRLTLYKNRGWDSHLHEALQAARLKKETLDTMWRTIEAKIPILKKYIDAKKKLLGMDSNRWYDQYAPCGTVDKQYSYDDAAKFIIENKGSFSSDMAEFSKHAIDRRWIEAEDRAGKMGGGYCTGMGPKRETRIFMTYANSYENLLTLAHELGHAYHSWVLKEKAYLSTAYPMTLAETASIFAELLVTDAALQTVTDPREKLMLLDQKLQQPYTMFCNIYCRYLFEDSFYTERRNGVVSRDRLNELMLAAQKRAFGGLLDADGYHKYFWASKLHFFISERAFYNFPYTFGYLFAGGVYNLARKEGKSFADKYRALLADTGSMTTEEVAMKHLGADLTRDQFWTEAVNRSLADVDEYVRLAGELGD